ncbi:MAG: hypothetical protein EI684_06865 [Candidatus Viridilinea halotolerans]|uniref:GHMP kinase C-terminal domain-containing protein n=1 Tax=Candidatus Viridilinea halotolerans TaxID=2491704 RepID=A0A426U3R2_9CHLR|nr:MAG: hypothetical protein EI684_06865 [Candidatus Viridilinea halotolerans]
MPTELDRFIRLVRAQRGAFFAHGPPITVAHAPGWVELMGGAAAVGGALALAWPLGSGSFVALQPNAEAVLAVQEVGGAAMSLPLSALVTADGAPCSYDEAAAYLARVPAPVRLAGAMWLALAREEFARCAGGARLLVRPNPTPGAQVGMAAALAQAMVAAYHLRLAPRELALTVHVGLQRILGNDPGVLGPLVGIAAHSSALLLVHQQPAWIWGELHLPPGTTLWAVVLGQGQDPATLQHLRVASQIAYRLAATTLGLSQPQADAQWLGYLSNLGTAHYEARIRDTLPVTLSGAEFLAKHTPPPGLVIEPERNYPLRAAASLAIEEHLRARMVAALLRAAASKTQREEDLQLVGEIMARSHGGQRAAGLGDPRADNLVAQLAHAGSAQGIYGARASVATSGATLVVLGRSEAEADLHSLITTYGRKARLAVTLFGGSSAGAASAGTYSEA